MALKGDLASVDLAQVFQMLSLNQKVGILGIDAARASHALHFDSRGVTLFFDEPALHERVILQGKRRGLVSDGALQDARAHSQRTGQSVLQSLVAGGYLTQDDVSGMTRAELEEDLYDIFFWRKAQFEFYEGATSIGTGTDRIDERFYFSVDSVIMEAARRIDEWAFIQQRVKSGEEVFRRLPVDPSALADIDALVFGLTDGMRNVARLIDLTGLPRFQVFKSLAVLHEGGYVERVPDEDLWAAAIECVNASRPADAIDLYEHAIECGADGTKIRSEVAGVYEQVEEFAKAAKHLKRVAVAHVEAGEVGQAVRHYSHIVQMLPTDLDAREQLVSLAVSLPENQRDGVDPGADGKQLVDLYLEIGEVERVRSILEQLLRNEPHDLSLKKRLINVHTKAGDTRRVVELYESMAEDLVREREPIEAVKYLQKIVMIDRSRRDISERIRGLYEADERRRSRRRSLVAIGALFLLLSALGGVWFVYERYAREQMIALESTITQLTQADQFDEAIARLDSFVAKYPLTIVAHDASSEKARVESLRASHENKLRIEQRQQEFKRQEIRQHYRGAWEEYERRLRDKDLGQALVAIKKVQELVAEAGAPQDLEWARKNSVQNNRFDLERYISEAARIDREANDKLESGDWRAARELWLTLLRDFDISEKASNARVPVMVRSRPIGAEVWIDGKRLTRPDPNDESSELPIVTPTVLLCRYGEIENVELRLAGFANSGIELDGSASEVIEPTMRVVPERRFEFNEPVRTSVAVGGKFVVAGLRGGKLAVADARSGDLRVTRQLEGLDEVRGKPTIAVDRCYYVTNEGMLASRRASSGQLIWRVRLSGMPVHDPVVHSGRILLCDEDGMLFIHDPLTGAKLGSVALGGLPVGEPCIEGGVAYVGLREGVLIGVDLVARKITARATGLPSGVATRLFSVAGGFVYGDDRGEVVFRRRLNGPDTWSFDTDQSFESASALTVVGDGIYVRIGSSGIVRLRAEDGAVQARIDLDGQILEGPFVTDRRVYSIVRALGDRSASDLLQAFEPSSLELLWEFGDGGRFAAPPTVDSQNLYLPDSSGDVLRFR